MPLANIYSFEAIGTTWSIETSDLINDVERQRIQDYIASFDAVYSRFRTDSAVAKLAKHEKARFPDSLDQLLAVYRDLEKVSSGGVNPLVGTSLEALGYDAEYSLIAKEAVTPTPSLSAFDYENGIATLDVPAILDVGAVGKGYLIDRIAEIVSPQHPDYVIDGSGDILARLNQPETIGLEHPDDPAQVIGAINLKTGSLCASATNRRAWGDGLHHIIDARTGAPLQTDIIATWAIADDAFHADALTTGLFFVNPEELQGLFGTFQYVIMKRNGIVQHNITNQVGEIF